MAWPYRLSRRFKSLSSTIRSRQLSVSTYPKHPEDSSTIEPRFVLHSAPDPKPSDHSPFLLFPKTHISTLPNGIRVATQTSPPHVQTTATVGVWIDAGSRFETPETNGTAHFLEHMIFKGTRRRTARGLEEEIENMGARLNAYTSREQTTFYANVLREDVPVAVDILADILQNSTFSEQAIRRERDVILREMEEVQGQTEEVIFDHLHSVAFRDSLLGNTILGPPENIRSISRNNLYQYISTHYTSPRMVVSAAGAVEHDEIVSLVERLFKDFSMDPTSAAELVDRSPAIFTGSEVRLENNDMPIAHWAIAFKGAAWADPNSIPIMVIQSLLGSWCRSIGVGNCSGSQLARRVGTLGLAESIMAFNTNYCDTGLFGIYATAMPDCLGDLSCVIMEELRRLAWQVSDAEVIRARNQLKSALLLHIDGTSAVAENNGRQLLTYGRIVPFQEYFTRIDAVDAATIKEMARDMLVGKIFLKLFGACNGN
ncbi:hypothetical protein QJS04_geneDACA009299 [Acorus gramineus]|uniref:Mitochondrial-processing peptidase subunit beta n=1 Tax=Acorus gramineus TaxID=55184 RepID=A0AAV9A2I4_ACOGR|nr:hypothetical protein QJS04_geneDACA009299 [Acorus gramineus]